MRLTKSLGVTLLATLATSSQVIAQEDRHVDVMPFLTRVDEDRGTERQAWGLRGAYGWGWGGNWFSEVQLFGTQLESGDYLDFTFPVTDVDPSFIPPSGDTELSGLGFDMVYSFSGRNGYSPYLLGGVGVSNNNYTDSSYFAGEDDTNAFVNLAAGITSGGIGPHGLKVRAEIRYLRDYFADDMDDWQFGIGLSIPLSCPPVATPVYAEPPKEPVDEQPEIINTDSDGDGVLDRNDRCPDTLPGAEVDENGCVVAEQTITLENIQFEFNSAKLTPAAEMSLNRVVQSLRSQPDSQVEVAGHTDSQGNDAYNMRLSRQRAESVRSYLVRGGIDANRISARGYGETQPVASNATDAGRAQNRRVEMRFR
ncbi:OmpA family protein [uncultured Microbulbifer sp.]|uniref:OmpA family protein n=1 Tax=uncultured Microbulbifer sp. TaxID=348147 RepID=UPI0025ECA4A8|nr:OmpA family protein [uncultured Microbulbifer sp.]